jgi:hypothetical protein
MEKQLISYSGIRKFLNCRRAYYWRYIERIEPLYTSDALSFGKLIHACLEALYAPTPYAHIIDENYADLTKGKNAHHKALAHAIMEGYAKKYIVNDNDSMRLVSLELPFECDIINPATGRMSRKFRLRGFIDRVNKRPDGIWLHEYKTTAQLNDGYISRISHNLQELLYVIAYEQKYKVKVRGIIHDAMLKVALRQGKKEAFEEFVERLKQRYLTDPTVFHREEIIVDRGRLEEARQELWDATQDIGKCKTFYKNRGNCHGFGECEFFKICNSKDNPLVIKNFYREREDDIITNRKAAEEQQPF